MPSTTRYLALGYGYLAYGLALATVGYAVGFLANAVVPKTIDSGTGLALADPVLVNVGLLAVFGVQHSLMARPWFKAYWTRLVPEPIERSTYVVCSSLVLLGVMWAWRPMPDVIWTVEGAAAPVLWIIYLGGWVLMFVATNLIDGQALMGLRQVEAYWNDRRLDPLEFQTPSLYRSVRNPIMTGFLVAFWVTPRMTLGHLLFAIGSTSYILVGTKLEERDLLAAFGRRYREYRDDVPAFVPRPWRLAPRPRPDDRD